MDDCKLTNFFCGFLLGFMFAFTLSVLLFDDEYQELKQFREQKVIEQELNQRGCK